MAKYLSIKVYCSLLAVVCLIIIATVYKDQIPYTTFSTYTTFSNGKLTRSQAKELIGQNENFVSATKLSLASRGMKEVGIEQGLWYKYNWHNVKLTEEGKRYFTEDIDFTNSLKDALVLKEPLKRVVVEVKGIADGMNGLASDVIKEVQFTWEYREMSDVVALYSGESESMDRKGAALMRLYDDGWRVEEIEVE
ncbi:MAG: hypothetical protein AAB461_01105 [Patescibacteria group bacterium]